MARVIVTGLIAQHRSMGGVAWDYLNVVIGLKQMGHDVYYLEDSGEWPYLESGPADEAWVAHDPSGHVGYLAETMRSFGLAENWAYRFPIRDEWYGMPRPRREEVLRTADILLNVSGTLDYPDRYSNIPTLLYLDTDPVFTQIGARIGGESLLRSGRMGLRVCGPGESPDEALLEGWTREEKLRRRIDLHDVFFTVGETIDRQFGDGDHPWHPTKHPIALSEWRAADGYREAYTTVANWTSYPPVVFEGRSFGQKDVEMIRFIGLPRSLAPTHLEIAMPDVHHVAWQSQHEYVVDGSGGNLDRFADETPQSVMRRHGWEIVKATDVVGDFRSYRQYLQRSKGEFSVAKHGYVAGCSGWFSGRTACYLAAGRPAIVQNTGFSAVIPTGAGVLGFTTVEEARDSVRQVESDYAWHSRAATAIAEEFFDSTRVLRRMLDHC